MNALAEADVRRIVRDELELAARADAAESLHQNRAFAEHMVESAERAEDEHPATPGSLLDKIQGLRRGAAEYGLAHALITEASSDLVESFPDAVDVGCEVSFVEPVFVFDESSAGDGAATQPSDLVDEVVIHDSSPTGSGQVLDTPDSPKRTVGEPSIVPLPPGSVAPGEAVRDRSAYTTNERSPGF